MLLLPPDNTWCTDLKTTKQMDKWRNTKTVGTALGSKDCNRECHTYVHSVCFIQLRHCRMSFIVDQSAAMKCPENVFFLFFFVIYVTLFICLMNESARELNSVIISDEWIIILLHAIRVCINNCRLVLIDFFFCCCDDWLCLMTTYHHITHHSLMIRIRNFMSNSNRVTFQLEFIWITNSAWEFSSILSFVVDVVWWFSVGSLWERQQSVCEWILFILPTK